VSEYPYQRIAHDLQRDILEGRLGPGAPLPSERELATRYGASRPAVRHAMQELRALGLVVTEHGRRTIVRPVPHVRLLHTAANYRRQRATGIANWNAEVIAQGQQPEQRLLEVGQVPAPLEVAERLQLEEGTPVVVRRRVFLVNGAPVQLGDSYYPLELAAGTRLELPQRITGGAHAVIEDQLGRHVARFVEDLTARLPTTAEARQLATDARGPVVRVLRTVYDEAGAPLEVIDQLMTAEHHEFRYEVLVGA
jgi:GntR family transcriptional regulator